MAEGKCPNKKRVPRSKRRDEIPIPSSLQRRSLDSNDPEKDVETDPTDPNPNGATRQTQKTQSPFSEVFASRLGVLKPYNSVQTTRTRDPNGRTREPQTPDSASLFSEGFASRLGVLKPYSVETRPAGDPNGRTAQTQESASLFSEGFTQRAGPFEPGSVADIVREAAAGPWGDRAHRGHGTREDDVGTPVKPYQLFPEYKDESFNISDTELRKPIGRGQALAKSAEFSSKFSEGPIYKPVSSSGDSRDSTPAVPGESEILPHWESDPTHAPIHYQMSRHVASREMRDKMVSPRGVSERRRMDTDTPEMAYSPRKTRYVHTNTSVDSLDTTASSDASTERETSEDSSNILSHTFRNLSLTSPERVSSSDSLATSSSVLGDSSDNIRSGLNRENRPSETPNLFSVARDFLSESHDSQPLSHGTIPRPQGLSSSSPLSHDISSGIACSPQKDMAAPQKDMAAKVEQGRTKNKRGRHKYKSVNDVFFGSCSSSASGSSVMQSGSHSSASDWVPLAEEEEKETPPNVFSEDDFPNLQRRGRKK